MRLYPHRRLAWAVLCTLYLRRHAGFRGLRTPEFIQADDFRTIIYRQEKVSDPAEKVSNPTEKVTEQEQKVSDPTPKVSNLDSKSVKPRPTAKQQKVLDFCDETPRTAQEILDMVGVKYHTKTLDQYINKLVDADLLRPTGAKIHDSNRRYITAHSSTDR